ncbi:MAG: hypothetical protein K2P79_00900 [Sphingomonas sp.]|jgi:hypothetical protein|nr:hypothetical protein [Sphingomonas sp.]
MTEEDRTAQTRYYLMTLARIAGAGGAVFGIVILARAVDWPEKAIGLALTLAALWEMAVVPRALAARWKSKPEP